MATGKMTRHMASESTVTSTELATRATGRKISSTDRASKPGQMVQAIRETMLKDARMVKDVSPGLIRALTRETSSRTTLKVTVSQTPSLDF